MSASKDVLKKLKSAKDALASGDGHGARALTREALELDDTSYDAWVFDGKAAFACGKITDALKSYKLAADLKSDHPAARRGAIEAAEKLAESESDSSSNDESRVSALVDALSCALALPADDKQLTVERRTEWVVKLAESCEALGRHADARTHWTTVLTRANADDSDDVAANLASPSPDKVVQALVGAARCALAEEGAASRADRDVAAAGVNSTTIASPAELRAARVAAAKVRAAAPNPTLDQAVRTLLDAEERASADDAVGAALLARGARAFDAKIDAVIATRAAARLDLAVGADAAAAAALDALGEVERLVMRHGDSLDVRFFAKNTALEAAAALDAGLDVEEEGWDETRAFDEESATLTKRVLAVLHSCDPFDIENGDPAADPTATVASIWSAFADPDGPGRSGRVAHAPGSAAAQFAFPPETRAALLAALRRDDAVVAASEKSSKEASTALPAETGVTMLGWGAVAEAALMADRPGEALDAARSGLKAVRAMRERERASRDDASFAPRAQAAERRLRVIAAEAMYFLGRLAEATVAFQAIVPPSPRTTRGLAGAVAANASSGEDPERTAAKALSIFKSAASEFGSSAPRPLAELGWAMLKAGGEGAVSSARRALERAAELARKSPDEEGDADVATGAPPDIAARLGVARWREAHDAGDTDAMVARGPQSARAALLAAAAVDGSWRASAFAHLALVYAASGDDVRAAKCRDRALSLDPTDPVAGPAACDAALVSGDEKSTEREIETTCRAALEASSRCAWAAVRLAPIAAARGEHEEAAAALRTTLRAAGADAPGASAAWEALGSSYDAMDKHSAALKSYRKATDLDGKPRVYSSTRSGRLLKTIGDLETAVACHTDALVVAPNHPAPALGLAEAETARAQAAAKQGAPARAAAAAARAAEAAETAKVVRNAPLRASAKRAGDAYLIAARLRVPVDETAGSLSAPERAAVSRQNARASCRSARRAYARGIFLSPQRPSAWFDLAAACVAEAEIDDEASRAGEVSSKKETIDSSVARASRCIRASLRLDPTNPAAWIALGTLPTDPSGPNEDKARDRARRETALARAATLDPSSAPAWSALGRLFLAAASDTHESEELKFNSLRRASLALDKARAADPNSQEAWTATAALHAANRDSPEAAGAARAAANAGNSLDAHKARALWGVRSASTTASDTPTPTSSAAAAYASARRAREASPSDSTAALALGLCAEARGRFPEAKAAFEDAAALVEATGATVFATAVANEAREGAERVAVKQQTPKGVNNSCLDPSSLRRETRHAQNDVHSQPWCVKRRSDLCSFLVSSDTRGYRFAASQIVPDAFYAPKHTKESTTTTAETITRAAVVAAAAALAVTPGGYGPDAERDVNKIGRNLARAIRAHPACVAANEARALLALVAARRVVAANGATSPTHAAASCVSLASVVAQRDPRLATALLVAASEVSRENASPAYGSDAARLVAAAQLLSSGDSRGAETVFREVSRDNAVSVGGARVSPTGQTARLLLGATLTARAQPASKGGGGEPKAGKEAGKVLAKVKKGAVTGAVGASAASQASAAITAAAGVEA